MGQVEWDIWESLKNKFSVLGYCYSVSKVWMSDSAQFAFHIRSMWIAFM